MKTNITHNWLKLPYALSFLRWCPETVSGRRFMLVLICRKPTSPYENSCCGVWNILLLWKRGSNSSLAPLHPISVFLVWFEVSKAFFYIKNLFHNTNFAVVQTWLTPCLPTPLCSWLYPLAYIQNNELMIYDGAEAISKIHARKLWGSFNWHSSLPLSVQPVN